eukprot:2151727-Prymnesium_polylepis.1
MQQEVAAFESHGPLDSDVGEAGRGLPRCLQHAITQQRAVSMWRAAWCMMHSPPSHRAILGGMPTCSSPRSLPAS